MDVFKKYDDPEYWDEDGYDKRHNLGAIISYKDIKKLHSILPKHLRTKITKTFLNDMERWVDPVKNRIT